MNGRILKKIAVITSTRAEFGLLLPVIRELRKFENENLIIEVIVTGTHLNDDYGKTVNEIIKHNIRIDVEIATTVGSQNALDISKNQSITLQKFTSLFLKKNYSGIVLLGDRYEMLAIAIAAGNTHTPIFHLCGGDTTEGAVDEWIRHAITKMSYLHFPTNEMSHKRVIQLGESPDRVFNYGSTSIDNIFKNANMSRLEALSSLGLDDCTYAMGTYHPVTMDTTDVHDLMIEFIKAIQAFPDINFIVTKSNADQGGEKINRILDEANQRIPNLHVYASLGVIRYLSLMKYAQFVFGNSSSGIIEAPAFKIPTVNIGDRQRGRLQSQSIINCNEDRNSIIAAINWALSDEHRKICANVRSPYGNGYASEKIAHKIVEVVNIGDINLKKKFYDIDIK